jgi:ATP-dependent Clp protease protease subunit
MSDKIKDMVSDFHDYDICFGTKTIKIFGEIDKKMKNRTISNLHLLDQVTGDVTILLSSEGGNVSDGLAIFDAIRAMKNRVKIIAYEEVASMASVIFQAADEGCRYMMPNSYLMLHEGESGNIGRKKDREEWDKLQSWHDDKCINVYLKNIKTKKKRFSKNNLNKMLEKDWILKPKEAIFYGLADDILEVY